MHKAQEKKSWTPPNKPFKDLKTVVQVEQPIRKQNVLMVFGVGDTFCWKESPRFLKAGEKIFADTSKLIMADKKNYAAYLNIREFSDTRNKISPYDYVGEDGEDMGGVFARSLVDLKMYNPDVFSKQNVLEITGGNGLEKVHMRADNIDMLLPPTHYNIFICGIDINGAFIGAIDKLIDLGYFVTVYSDIIKPYSKDTIDYLINSSKVRENHLRFGKS